MPGIYVKKERAVLILAISGSAYTMRGIVGREHNFTVAKFFNCLRQNLYPVSIVNIKAILLAQRPNNFKCKMFTVMKKLRMNGLTYNNYTPNIASPNLRI